jgi:2-methylcitrate dehydratase
MIEYDLVVIGSCWPSPSLMATFSQRSSARYPREVPSRVTVRLNDGKSYSHEVKSYPGFPTRPFTWDEIGAKFDKLVAGRADDGLAREIKAAVRSLETIQVKDLMKLLGHVTADQRG